MSKSCEAKFRSRLRDPENFDRYVQNFREMHADAMKRRHKNAGVADCEQSISFIEDEANDLARVSSFADVR